MEYFWGFWKDVVYFLPLITVVVFVHEFGHFFVARWNGVKVETFSIGFGKELFGWNDKHGTRWRVSALPLGGYVKMFGDADESSTKTSDQVLSPEEQKLAFRHKRVGQRAAIVFAGPAANFFFAILALTMMFMIMGQQIGEPVIGEVMPESAALEAGLQVGDQVLTINGQALDSFDDIRRQVMLLGLNPLTLSILRNGETLNVLVTPHLTERKNFAGDTEHVPVLGVKADPEKMRVINHTPISALLAATHETQNMVSSTLIGIGQMFSGTRGTEELGGPIRIAKAAGEASKFGFMGEFSLAITLSVGLGLFNLFPIPVLDGGHLLFFGIEALLGRPLNEQAQEYGFRIGMFLVLALMVFATRNDLISLPLWQAVKHWVF